MGVNCSVICTSWYLLALWLLSFYKSNFKMTLQTVLKLKLVLKLILKLFNYFLKVLKFMCVCKKPLPS